MTSRHHRSLTGPRSERGYVLVTTALALVPLLLMSGLAIDYGGNYWLGIKLQRAADAASLAGVIWLPDFAKAQDVAVQTLEANGFSPTDGRTATIDQTAS